jgi:DNA-binding MarR family transcriptional regulator
MTVPHPTPRLVFGLMKAERSVRRWIDARAEGSGVSAAGVGVLFHLAAHGHALVGDVTAALSASASGTSGLLSRLATAGLIVKTQDPVDARAVRLSLTPHGVRTAASARAVLDELNGHLADGFTPSELQTVSRWLAHAANTLRPDD